MNNIQQRRNEKNISQSQLAMLSGVSVRMIQKYETGDKDINKASAGTVYRLGSAFGCNINVIINIEKEVMLMNFVGMN